MNNTYTVYACKEPGGMLPGQPAALFGVQMCACACIMQSAHTVTLQRSTAPPFCMQRNDPRCANPGPHSSHPASPQVRRFRLRVRAVEAGW